MKHPIDFNPDNQINVKDLIGVPPEMKNLKVAFNPPPVNPSQQVPPVITGTEPGKPLYDSELGLGVGCSRCYVANLYDDKFDCRGLKNQAEHFAELCLLANRARWSFKVLANNDARFFCPRCTDEMKKKILLPRYKLDNVCTKCGTAKASVKFCNGRTNCNFDVADDHLHRVCPTCQFEWLEAPMDGINVRVERIRLKK